MTKEELDAWYGRQPFDNVKKITGIDPMDYPEADDADEQDATRDDALDEAREIWDDMELEEKQSWFETIGDNW